MRALKPIPSKPSLNDGTPGTVMTSQDAAPPTVPSKLQASTTTKAAPKAQLGLLALLGKHLIGFPSPKPQTKDDTDWMKILPTCASKEVQRIFVMRADIGKLYCDLLANGLITEKDIAATMPETLRAYKDAQSAP